MELSEIDSIVKPNKLVHVDNLNSLNSTIANIKRKMIDTQLEIVGRIKSISGRFGIGASRDKMVQIVLSLVNKVAEKWTMPCVEHDFISAIHYV